MKSIQAVALAADPVEISDSAVPVFDRFRPAWRWLMWILIFLAAVWAVTAGISALIQHTRLKTRLTAHIAAALGRRVEVDSYEFSVWAGPRLEAQSISVAEDPRFGQEYFLRAESISLRLRWSSLLRGHLAIDTLSLTRPSLNLVRNASGDWNLAEWLPRPTPDSLVGAPYPVPSLPAVRFRRIEVEGGRINFKRADDKLPFALVGLTGVADTDASGRWRLDVTATPWRAAVPLQQAGVLHASGTVGGTSSRLRPAKLDISWSDASFSDVLRLARGDDYGIRGTLGASISAVTREQDDGWAIRAHVQLGQLHRWDLALRPDNPAANIIFETQWHPSDAFLVFNPVVLEAPHSNASVSAGIVWGHPESSGKPLPPPFYAEVSGAQVDAGDALSWVRAFHSGIADDAGLQGLAAVQGVVSGWPPHVANATVLSDGVALSAASLPAPAHVGAVQFGYAQGTISLSPVEISFGRASANTLRLESLAKPGKAAVASWRLSGGLSNVRDLLAATSTLGWQLSPNADLAGPVRGDLRWQGMDVPWKGSGFIEWGFAPGSASTGSGLASLRAPFLNLPADMIRARVDFDSVGRRVTLASAQAFGAHWTGTFDRHGANSPWQFALSADQLSAADLDRWLNPRWRQSFLGRMFPFLNPAPPAITAGPENLRAAGRLTLARFTLGSLAFGHMEGDLRIGGRSVDFQNGTAQLAGGVVTGSFSAQLQPVPEYEGEVDFARVDLSSLTDAIPLLAGLYDGSISGETSFRARGATRADLLASLDCRGNAVVTRPLLRKIDLVSSLGDGAQHPGVTRLSGASADFSCAQQVVRLENLSLDSPELDSTLAGAGSVDFSHNLSLTLRSAASGSPVFRLTGTLATPTVAVVPPSPRRPR